MPVPTPSPLARPVGYALVLGLALLLFFAAGFFAREWARAPRLLRVHFPEIATLAEGDPVVQAGVPVGVVRSIRLPGAASGSLAASNTPSPDAVVTIELFNRRPLPRDSRFVNFSHSLMGARRVWIVPGASASGAASPRDAGQLDESGIQDGLFAPGLPETLHKVDSLVVLISRLREQTERMLTEDNPVKSPWAAARALDSAAVKLDRLTAGLETARAALEAGLAGFSSAAHETRRGLHAAEPGLRSTFLKAAELVNAVASVQNPLDTLLTRVEKISAMAGDSTGMGRLLNGDRAFVQLEQGVRLLESVANAMRNDGLTDSLKIRPRLKKPPR